MTRFDFSPAFRTLLDFALLLRLVDGVEIAAMTSEAQEQIRNRRDRQAMQFYSVQGDRVAAFILGEIDEAAEARMHDEPEVRRLWISARSRCKAIEQNGQRTGSGDIDQFRCDRRLSHLWHDARIECI